MSRDDDTSDAAGSDGESARGGNPDDAGRTPDVRPGTASDAGDADRSDGDGGGDSGADADRPVEVGDGRRKHVAVVTAEGERTEHGDVFLRHSAAEFVVSESPSFDEADATRYRKADLARVEVTQHHSSCFITTAAAGEGATLDALREFRDDALAPSPVGRALLAVYDGVSPSVAATLARHPDVRTTRGVRWLVDRCGRLARRRDEADSTAVRTALTLLLTALYAVGVAFAVAGACAVRLCERLDAE